MVIIAGFGNPLLDITVQSGVQLLEKYRLNADDQCEVDENTMASLLDDIKNLIHEFSPGGSVQNTLRIFQWLCQGKDVTYMIGGIGSDNNGLILKNLVERSRVKTMYITNDELPTGLTVAITNQENRSLVASIGAAKYVTLAHFDDITSKDGLLNKVDLIYMEGFFLPNRQFYANQVMEFAKLKDKLFAFNISARYICKDKNNPIENFAKKCDILFGNQNEYEALAEVMQFSGNTIDLALHLNSTTVNKNWRYAKMLIITNGSKTVTCIHSVGQVEKLDVPKISTNDLKDTTGAGDSFVAGFLFGLLKGYSPDLCLKYGCWTAQQIIKQVGCQTPNCIPDIIKC